MKTRDRILHASLLLFNDEGQNRLSSVDIANALEISPGHLYYHFKGKDAIIRALYDRFEEEMLIILRGSQGRIGSIEDQWVYIYILLEEIYDFRFFYRDLPELTTRYPDVGTRFRRLIEEMQHAINQSLKALEKSGLLKIERELKEPLREQIIRTLTFWIAGNSLRLKPLDGKELIHQTVFDVMCLIVPHLGESAPNGFQTIQSHLRKSIG